MLHKCNAPSCETLQISERNKAMNGFVNSHGGPKTCPLQVLFPTLPLLVSYALRISCTALHVACERPFNKLALLDCIQTNKMQNIRIRELYSCHSAQFALVLPYSIHGDLFLNFYELPCTTISETKVPMSRQFRSRHAE
jgi:hypothetical protein